MQNKDISETNKKYAHLAKYLIPRSKCPQDITPMQFKEKGYLGQWKITGFDYDCTGAGIAHCPCGQRIMIKCWIRNVMTKERCYVGSICIRHFENEQLNGILNVEASLHSGLTGKLAEETHTYYAFEMSSSRSNAFKYAEHIFNHYGNEPISTASKTIYTAKPANEEDRYAMRVGADYKFVSQLEEDPKSGNAVIRFISLKQDYDSTKNEESWSDGEQKQEEEEEEDDDEEEEGSSSESLSSVVEFTRDPAQKRKRPAVESSDEEEEEDEEDEDELAEMEGEEEDLGDELDDKNVDDLGEEDSYYSSSEE